MNKGIFGSTIFYIYKNSEVPYFIRKSKIASDWNKVGLKVIVNNYFLADLHRDTANFSRQKYYIVT